MITIKIEEDVLKQIESEYSDYIETRNVGYILFVAKFNGNIITAYENKKGASYKVTFQGEDSVEIAKKYCPDGVLPIKKKEKISIESPYFIDVDEQIGSDEVGTGDFLLPIIVCAAFVDHETMEFINKYDIKDSKKFTDKKILEVIPLILKKVHYEIKILENERYNNAVEKGFNMVKIKCILHNHVLTKLHERCPYVKNIYIDQFTPDYNYYAHLSKIENVTKNIIFKEKGESYFPSVALASCIARYFLLKEREFRSKKIGLDIPFGAGIDVDEFSKKFISKYGIKKLATFSKKNFRNYIDLEKIMLL